MQKRFRMMLQSGEQTQQENKWGAEVLQDRRLQAQVSGKGSGGGLHIIAPKGYQILLTPVT